MYARVSTYEGRAEDLDRTLENVRSTTIPAIRQVAGFEGILVFVDRESGRSVSVTLWESEEAMRNSEQQANTIRDDSAERNALQIASIERYEVADAIVPQAASTPAA